MNEAGAARLAEAIAAHAAWRAQGGDMEEFLTRHSHLRSLLEPMMRPPSDDDEDEPDPRASLGDFRLVRELGRGGMGVVWEAEQISLRRRVAVKLLSPMLLVDTAAVARFHREAALAARLDHPGITKVLAFVAEADTAYLAMELVSGASLAAVIDAVRERDPSTVTARELVEAVGRTAVVANGPAAVAPAMRGVDLFVQWVIEVAQALHFAHGQGVVHRDVKPSNILIRRDDLRAVLTDFGLAREQGTLGVTRSGEFAGTVSYSAPEMFLGDARRIGPAADVFALGVTLYELLAFRRPFDAYTLSETQARIERSEPANPRHANPAIDRDLWAVLQRALEKNPASRYPSAEALAADLGRWRRREPVLARPVPWLHRCARWARRNPLASAFLTFAAVALVVVSYFWQDARTQAASASSRQREFDLLAVKERHRRVLAAEADLSPPWPGQIGAMQAWLKQANDLLDQRTEIVRTVSELQKRVPAPDARSQPDSSVVSPPGQQLAPEEEAQRFLRTALVELLGDLDALAADKKRVVERLDWARRIGALTAAHPRARTTWAAARAAIDTADGIVASTRYRGQAIELRDQEVSGLVPIGMNPVTKLWEFYELRSAWDGVVDPASIEIPSHITEGERAGDIDVQDGTGIVLVLLPGGPFTMGSQKHDSTATNHDPMAKDVETMYEVRLAPFFLARHELTQGQWRRLVGSTPSGFAAESDNNVGGTISWSHPVETINWTDADRWLRWQGLALPTEAQWEYGCRGGTTTPWSCALEQLQIHANLADDVVKNLRPESTCETWLDGHYKHAPVGSFRPNGFGMFDVHGNVWEWIRDGWEGAAVPPRPGDGLRAEPASSQHRAARGGGYYNTARSARCAVLKTTIATFCDDDLGIRAARALRIDD